MAVAAADQRTFRDESLALLAREVDADRGLFHELSPRAPLDAMALLGVSRAAVMRTLPRWDELAAQLEGFFALAARQGGLACDDEALPPSGPARRLFTQRVARPLGLATLAILHLPWPRARVRAAAAPEVVASAVVLGRSRARPFSTDERARLRAAIPVLALGDALWSGAPRAPRHGRPLRLACVDTRLTTRQRELVELVALGRTNREIAVALSLSEHGVRNHLARIFARLGAANRADLVRVAVLQPGQLGMKVPIFRGRADRTNGA